MNQRPAQPHLQRRRQESPQLIGGLPQAAWLIQICRYWSQGDKKGPELATGSGESALDFCRSVANTCLVPCCSDRLSDCQPSIFVLHCMKLLCLSSCPPLSCLDSLHRHAPALPCPALSCPALSCPTLPCPTLPCRLPHHVHPCPSLPSTSSAALCCMVCHIALFSLALPWSHAVSDYLST